MLSVPVMSAPLGGVSTLSAASLAARLPSEAPVPSAAAPAASVAAVAPAAVSAAPFVGAPGTIPALPTSALPARLVAPVDAEPTSFAAARSAASVVFESASSSAEFDVERADFADGLRVRAGGAVSAFFGSPRRRLAPPARGGPAPKASGAPDKSRRPFFRGVFAAQMGNFGIQGILAAVILSLAGGSVSRLFFTVGATALADSAGSFAAGWLAEKNPMKAVRSLTAVRAVVLLSIPLLAAGGFLSLPIAVGAFMLDALARGVVDAASYSYLATAGGSDKVGQKSVNSEYSSKFELGAIAGPVAVAALLAVGGLVGSTAGLLLAEAFIPACFLAAAVFFKRVLAPPNAVPSAPGNPARAARAVFSDPLLRAGFVALLALTLYPLRSALPQMYATMLFHNPLAAGWLVAVFGLGGVVGSWLFRRPRLKNVSLRAWGFLGAAGTLALAVAWVFPVYAWAVPAMLLFSMTNMTARIAVQSEFMARLPADKAGNLSAFSRAGVKVMAMLVKYLPSLSTMLVLAPTKSFLILGGALGAFSLAQVFAAKKMAAVALVGALAPALATRAPSPVPDAHAPFYRNPAADRAKFSAKFMEDMLDPKKGEGFFFRVSKLATNERFDQLAVSKGMPEVVLHGNPIVENVKRTPKAIWVEDFDNAGLKGKYGHDIARLLISLSYYEKKPVNEFLGATVADSFKNGYRHGLRHPENGFPGMKELEKGYLEKVQPTMNEYFAADRKKIRDMRENPIPVDDRGMLELLRHYLKSIKDERLLDDYKVELAGKDSGTTEQWDATLVLLKPKDARNDRILFVIKSPSRPQGPPAGHFGRRVVESADWFAPGTLLRPGFFTSAGREYYGYKVSTLKGKIKKKLPDGELAGIAFSVGAELGRGARLALSDREAQKLDDHAERHFADIVAAAAAMKREIEAAYAAYAAEAARLGPTPVTAAAANGDGENDGE